MDRQKLVKDILQARKDSLKELDTVPWNVRPAHEVAKNEAKERYQKLLAEYRQYVVEAGAAIILRGPRARQEEFAALAQDTGDTCTLDAMALYDRIAAVVWNSQQDDRFGSLQVSAANERARELAHEIGYGFAVKNGVYDEATSASVPNRDECRNQIRNAIRITNGDMFNANFLIYNATQMALENEEDKPVIPFIVVGAEDGEELTFPSILFNKRVIVVDVPEGVVTENDVVKSFNQLKNKLNPK